VRAVRILVLLDRYPVLSETFVVNELRALAAAGHDVTVEALDRGEGADPGLPVRYRDEDSRNARGRSRRALLARHPLRCAVDLAARRRWRKEEWPRPLAELAPAFDRAREADLLYCHFAAGAALDTVRLARLTGRPYALTAHAFDIWSHPRNLAEKLRGAAVVATGCAYNARHLASLGVEADVIVMGVDPERFRRTAPLPGGRTVLAVGRLVEKKGFEDLARAAALVDARVRIVGDGPLRDRIAAAGPVEMLGALAPDRVREELEAADLLAMPSVIAPDGDRDSMPVVVKEAMAMERLVVATGVAGLPECVRPPWGRLVAPHDPSALAAAIDASLALGPAERAAAGEAGRAWVLQHADVRRETARLVARLGALAD
jgi:glycosyltransferase involved in cell wall biosynthesis